MQSFCNHSPGWKPVVLWVPSMSSWQPEREQPTDIQWPMTQCLLLDLMRSGAEPIWISWIVVSREPITWGCTVHHGYAQRFHQQRSSSLRSCIRAIDIHWRLQNSFGCEDRMVNWVNRFTTAEVHRRFLKLFLKGFLRFLIPLADFRLQSCSKASVTTPVASFKELPLRRPWGGTRVAVQLGFLAAHKGE